MESKERPIIIGIQRERPKNHEKTKRDLKSSEYKDFYSSTVLQFLFRACAGTEYGAPKSFTCCDAPRTECIDSTDEPENWF